MILKSFSFKMKLCAVVQGNALALRGEHEKIIEQQLEKTFYIGTAWQAL